MVSRQQGTEDRAERESPSPLHHIHAAKTGAQLRFRRDLTVLVQRRVNHCGLPPPVRSKVGGTARLLAIAADVVE
jgi:hypothetical protein